jgi:enediyne biosynthesis protein E4
MRTREIVASLALALVTAGCGGGGGERAAPDAAVAAGPRFVECAAASGISFRHRSGAGGRRLLPEIMGGGAAWIDANGDGRLDAFLVDSGALAASGGAAVAPRHALFLNLGDGRFEDATERSFHGSFKGYGMGVASGDYDADGDADLYVTGLGGNQLWRNEGGRFVDATAEAGVAGGGWSVPAAFVDYDADGDLDLFVGDYVAWRDSAAFLDRACRGFGGAPDYCSPQAYAAPSFATLYRNEGGGRFRDVSESARLRTKAGTALGVVCTDLDGDGRVDVYVANDQMHSFAWLNRGDAFVEDGLRLGLAVDELGKSQAGMGTDVGDVDGDGDFDVWKVHLDRESHVLYANVGGVFEDRTTPWRLAAPTRPYTGFGTAFLDVDADGLLDLFVADGRVEASASPADPRDPYAERDQLLMQAAPGRFVDATAEAGPAFAAVATSRGAAFGDYDDDGDVDVLIACRDAPARLLRNDSTRRGAWCGVRVVGAKGADVHGARVSVVAGGRTFVDETRTAFSYCAANDPRVLFGLGPATEVASIEVSIPQGGRKKIGPLPVGGYVTVSF